MSSGHGDRGGRSGRGDRGGRSGRGRRLLLTLVAIVVLGGAVVWLTVARGGGESGEDLSAALATVRTIDRAGLPPRVTRLVDERIAAVEASPGSARAWGALGEALDVHEVYGPAITCYRAARQLAPKEFAWTYLLAIALEYEGSEAEAALEEFRRAAAMAPSYPPVFFRLGEALARLGRLDEARAAHEEALRLDPTLAIARRSLGQVLLQMNEPASALAHLEAAAKAHPDDRTVWITLARVYQLLGRADDATAASARLADLGPTMALPDPIRKLVADQALTADRYAEIANELIESGDVEAAARSLQTAVEIDPNEAHLRIRLGRVLVTMNRPAAARAEFLRALELNDGLAGAHVGLGIIALAEQDPASAVRHLRGAIEIDPDNGVAHAKLGTALAISGAPDAASDAFAEAERLKGMDEQAYRNWGTARERMNDVAGAIDRYRAAVTLNPDYVKARFSLGRLLESTGRPAEAIEQYRLIVRVDPRHPAAARLRELEGR